jgi:hypothetical protein
MAGCLVEGVIVTTPERIFLCKPAPPRAITGVGMTAAMQRDHDDGQPGDPAGVGGGFSNGAEIAMMLRRWQAKTHKGDRR